MGLSRPMLTYWPGVIVSALYALMPLGAASLVLRGVDWVTMALIGLPAFVFTTMCLWIARVEVAHLLLHPVRLVRNRLQR